MRACLEVIRIEAVPQRYFRPVERLIADMHDLTARKQASMNVQIGDAVHVEVNAAKPDDPVAVLVAPTCPQDTRTLPCVFRLPKKTGELGQATERHRKSYIVLDIPGHRGVINDIHQQLVPKNDIIVTRITVIPRILI
jgi:hypothetical protein